MKPLKKGWQQVFASMKRKGVLKGGDTQTECAQIAAAIGTSPLPQTENSRANARTWMNCHKIGPDYAPSEVPQDRAHLVTQTGNFVTRTDDGERVETVMLVPAADQRGRPLVPFARARLYHPSQVNLAGIPRDHDFDETARRQRWLAQAGIGGFRARDTTDRSIGPRDWRDGEDEPGVSMGVQYENRVRGVAGRPGKAAKR